MPEMTAAASNITLGILAGGRASRLGGIDKAWLQHDGQPQVLRLIDRMRAEVGDVVVSANRNAGRYQSHGLTTVVDRMPGLGPIGGLDALVHACTTPWLLTLPVDLLDINDCLLRSLLAAGEHGAFAEDDDGVQPLLALWPVTRLREAVGTAIVAGDLAVHRLQSRLRMAQVRFDGVRFGNLNTPDDLAAVGIAARDQDEP